MKSQLQQNLLFRYIRIVLVAFLRFLIESAVLDLKRT